MISERLYYLDAYTTQFTANVIEIVNENGRSALILDKTYFYPTSGGQPHDVGTINQMLITDVEIRPKDGAVLHWLDTVIYEKEQVSAQINWERRFDHMQQHTGQHILSQAFFQIADTETVGFHLSNNSVTIDLNTSTLEGKQLDAAESLANQIVWQNLPVQIYITSPAEATSFPLRNIPEADHEKIRIVAIGNFDVTACGGTHVSATGAVGMIKVIKAEKHRGNYRIEFCCGNRALHDFQQKHTILTQLTSELTTGVTDLVNVVMRLQADSKQQRHQIKKQQNALFAYQAEELLNCHPLENNVRIITHAFEDMDITGMHTMAQLLTQQPSTVALMGIINTKTQLLFSRTEDAPGDMAILIKDACRALGDGSGGGRANQAQGGGTAVSTLKLNQILTDVKQMLISNLEES
jgi:alanyl-tRNA synthetase